jgi:hypothetical protein
MDFQDAARLQVPGRGREKAMYTGTLIEELIAAVERVESTTREERETAELERLYLAQPCEFMKLERSLLGVA